MKGHQGKLSVIFTLEECLEYFLNSWFSKIYLSSKSTLRSFQPFYVEEGYGTDRILFYVVKTQLSVPASETIQVINNLIEVSCLLLSPLTWSLPPLFPEESFASPPRPHSWKPSSFSLLTCCQVLPKGEKAVTVSATLTLYPAPLQGLKSGPPHPLSTLIPFQPFGEPSRPLG